MASIHRRHWLSTAWCYGLKTSVASYLYWSLEVNENNTTSHWLNILSFFIALLAMSPVSAEADAEQQAKRIGDRFRANGIDSAKVYSSQWCRCMDTAELLDLGPVKPLEPLNSFFQNFGLREQQTAELEKWIRSRSLDQPLLLVTHQVNITALTGAFVNSGELVVIKIPAEGPMQIIGSLNTM